MKFQQLRFLNEVAGNGLNVSAAAETLHTSQPGVSKQIRMLEDELGIEIFVRRGKRVVDVTEPGKIVLGLAQRVLREVENLRQAADECAQRDTGSLAIATTHTQARYALPPVIREFRKRFPRVRLALQQSSPEHIAESVLAGRVDIGIATEALDSYPDLLTLPCYVWHHVVVVPARHPLLKERALTIPLLGQYPLITYDPRFTGRPHIDEAFAKHGVVPDIVLTAMDADVIKTYVSEGLGIGIIASVAFNPKIDPGLRAIDTRHLFSTNMTRLALRKGYFLRGYVYDFIELFAPHLERKTVEAAVAGRTRSDYQL